MIAGSVAFLGGARLARAREPRLGGVALDESSILRTARARARASRAGLIITSAWWYFTARLARAREPRPYRKADFAKASSHGSRARASRATWEIKRCDIDIFLY